MLENHCHLMWETDPAVLLSPWLMETLDTSKPIHWVQNSSQECSQSPDSPVLEWVSHPYLVTPASQPPTVSGRSWIALERAQG